MALESLFDPYVFLSFVMAILVFYSQYFETPTSLLKPLPGPKAWSIFGNLPQLLAGYFDLAALSASWRKTYGEGRLFAYRVFGRRVVVVSDARLVGMAFDHEGMCGRMKDALHEKLSGQMSAGILTSCGKTWDENNDFLTKYLRENFPERKLQELCRSAAKKLTDSLKQPSGQPCAPHDHVVRALVDIQCRIIYGENFALEDKTLRKLCDVIIKRQRHESGGFRRLLPTWLADVPFIGGRTSQYYDHELLDMVKDLLDDHAKAGAEHGPCFALSYRQEMEKRLQKLDESMVTCLSNHNLLWTCIDLLLVCASEASLQLTQSLVVLSAHPAVQARIHDVTLEEQPAKTDEAASSAASATPSSAAYIDAVRLETRRLSRVDLWNDSVIARDDVTLDDFEIPEGSIVVANGQYLRTCEEVWDDPADFRPSRFLSPDGSISAERRDLVSFVSGSKAMPTEVMTSSACSILLSSLCQRFKLSLPDVAAPLFGPDGIVHRNAPFTSNIRFEPR